MIFYQKYSVMDIYEYCMLHKYYFKKNESQPHIVCIYRFRGIPANNNRSHLYANVVEENWTTRSRTSMEMLQGFWSIFGFKKWEKSLSEPGLIGSEYRKVVFIWFTEYLPHIPWRRVTVDLMEEEENVESDEEIFIETD